VSGRPNSGYVFTNISSKLLTKILGTTTLSRMTLGIKTFSIMALSILTLTNSITAFSKIINNR
jgi:hypothetical protein